MFNILHNYFDKKKLKQPKYNSYPLLKTYDIPVNEIYNEFTRTYQWYY